MSTHGAVTTEKGVEQEIEVAKYTRGSSVRTSSGRDQ